MQTDFLFVQFFQAAIMHFNNSSTVLDVQKAISGHHRNWLKYIRLVSKNNARRGSREHLCYAETYIFKIIVIIPGDRFL